VSQLDLRNSLLQIVPPDGRADWEDVRRRAARRRRPVGRIALVFALLAFVTLAVGSALALSGRLGNLFHGTPVKDISPRERFLMTQFDMNGEVELIARRNGVAFYVIRRKDGRVCYSIGDARTKLTPAQRAGRFRFGGAECPLGFPSPELPVLNQSSFSYKAGDRESRLGGLQGFAADAVHDMGVIGRDNNIIFTVPVEGNVYTAGRRGFFGARGVVALDAHGKVLWVQCFALGRSPAPTFPRGGCGKYKNSPPPRVAATPRPVPKRPQEARNPVHQSGTAEGVTIDVRGSRIEADFSGISPAFRRLLVYRDGRVVFGCFKLTRVVGVLNASATYVARPFAGVVAIDPWNPYAHPSVDYTPFDGCTVGGTYGHSWNDAHGTHDAVEIPLTERGRRYLAERAVARDVAWLARARVFRDIRYATRPFTSGSAARTLGQHAVPLSGPTADPPVGKLGIWIGPSRRIVLAERAPTGRRFFFELRRGIAYRTNLTDFAQAF
jgi:hypothetical protein